MPRKEAHEQDHDRIEREAVGDVGAVAVVQISVIAAKNIAPLKGLITGRRVLNA